MRKIPSLRPRLSRPVIRAAKATYFQMHVYDQERARLEAERGEIAKRLEIIQSRLRFISNELEKLEDALKLHRNPVKSDQQKDLSMADCH